MSGILQFAAGAALLTAPVILPDGDMIQVYVAATPEARHRGLRGRTLADDRGMAFAFPSLGFHQMWMPPDMLVSLDMLWIDDQGKIVEIMEQAQPCKTPPCPALGGSFPSRYVLELPAGTVEIHGIRPGQFVSF